MPPPFLPDAALAREVADRFGTPCYVYDEPTLTALAKEVLAFEAPFGLDARFAIKANPSRAVLRLFDTLGLGFDASTVYEAARAVAAGIDAGKVQITAQVLGDGLEDLVRAGVRVTACSVAQVERIGAAFPGHAIGIRINPGEGSGHNNRTSVAGRDASFGVWHEHLPDALRAASQHRLRVTWAHHHVGSGGDPAKWAEIAAQTLALVEGLPDVTVVNLGGGFKVARVPGEKQTDLAKAAHETGALLRDFAARTGRRLRLEVEPGTWLTANAGALLRDFASRTGRRLRLEVEPGTWLTANAGAIVARVADVVSTGERGHVFVKVDAGMAEILRPAMYGAQHPIAFHAARDDCPLGEPRPLLVVGPCCESSDLLTPAPGDPEALGPRTLPLPAIGDLCAIGGAGAYCASMAARNYNSIPAAPEALRLTSGSVRLVRRRQAAADVSQDEV